ncbi:PEP-CTERM sorting domain-containing protein [Spirulina subsalsa FACHB-351]|uniref:PEP-CTERM sorting domain-containing protein n=1 Tax=Spirulina subsalsa FACHB-351 TaxID=234711 RepID=A0ABT3LBY4_9CYAN|nr:PEP-CTERM sorting domain-containing protein [Spirulina subsalsa]MCW6039003.1 PEP-CTERM sorting domain-containing protein [Spirulina subsalsa FACHB-351]
MKKFISTLLVSSAIAATGLAFTAPETLAQQVGQTCDVNNFDPAASMCEGSFDGNDVNFAAEINNVFGIADLGLTWNLDAKIDITQDGGGVLSGPNSLDFGASVLYNNSTEGSKGTWSFGEGLYDEAFVIVLKAANSFSAYYFEAGTSIAQGWWDTIGTSANANNGKAAELSHISLYLASSPDPDDDTSVPEPATLLGLALVGGAFGLSRRRSA